MEADSDVGFSSLLIRVQLALFAGAHMFVRTGAILCTGREFGIRCWNRQVMRGSACVIHKAICGRISKLLIVYSYCVYAGVYLCVHTCVSNAHVPWRMHVCVPAGLHACVSQSVCLPVSVTLFLFPGLW